MAQASLTRDQALNQLDTLAIEGRRNEAKKFAFQVLSQLPSDVEAREKLKQLCKQDQGFEPEHFLPQFEKQFLASPEFFIQQAANGWQYVRVLDHAFIDPRLPQSLKKIKKERSQPRLEGKLPENDSSPGDLIRNILDIDDLEDRWEAAQALVKQEDTLTLQDSFADSGDRLQKDLSDAISGDALNIVIIGAGCIGLALANGLKHSLGPRVNVLVIESRVYEKHIKRPYCRQWLTHIPVNMFDGIFDPDVTKILRQFGNNGYMGATLDLFETLLMLSSKKLGVRFYFDNAYDLSFIKESDTHLVFDATGGRLTIEDGYQEAPQNQDDISVDLGALQSHGKGHQTHGITNWNDAPPVKIQCKRDGAYFKPYLGQAPVTTAMFKLTGVPTALYEELMEFVQLQNSDSVFYIWPGNLKPELNRILILINLDRAGFEELGALVERPVSLKAFLDNGGDDLEHVDYRITRLINILKVRAPDALEDIGIEPPFLYRPYFRFMQGGLPRLYDRTLVPVGDSIFCGHPKVGNGLGTHLRHMQQVHDLILMLQGSHQAS